MSSEAIDSAQLRKKLSTAASVISFGIDLEIDQSPSLTGNLSLQDAFKKYRDHKLASVLNVLRFVCFAFALVFDVHVEFLR